MRLSRFALVRVSLLLACLLLVAATSAYQQVQTRRWSEPLAITIYPLNGDGQTATEDYIDALDAEVFADIERWGKREAERHALALDTPLAVTLGPPVATLPPAFPEQVGPLQTLTWGLRFRWWVWRNTPDDGPLTRVRVFVVYHQGEDKQPLAHSLGMQRGLLGLVHAFAKPRQNDQNNIVIAHEVLHTVGASDKYTAVGGPRFPEGYADPYRQPRHPQQQAEIMAGRYPNARGQLRMADSLDKVILNPWTAAEINWLD